MDRWNTRNVQDFFLTVKRSPPHTLYILHKSRRSKHRDAFADFKHYIIILLFAIYDDGRLPAGSNSFDNRIRKKKKKRKKPIPNTSKMSLVGVQKKKREKERRKSFFDDFFRKFLLSTRRMTGGNALDGRLFSSPKSSFLPVRPVSAPLHRHPATIHCGPVIIFYGAEVYRDNNNGYCVRH